VFLDVDPLCDCEACLLEVSLELLRIVVVAHHVVRNEGSSSEPKVVSQGLGQRSKHILRIDDVRANY